MPRAGRRRSVVWACFVENAASGKRRVLCRFCQHDLVANPIRMVRHIVKHCPSADEQHKKICREYQALSVPLRRHADAEGDAAEGDVHGDALHHHHHDTTAATAPHHQQHHALPPDVSPAVAMSFALATHAVAHFPLAAPGSSPAAQPHSVGTEELHRTPGLDESVVERVHEELALALATTDGPALRLLENAHFVKALELVNVPPLTASEVDTRVGPRLCERLEADASAVLRSATAITVQLTAAVGLEQGTLSAPREIELTSLIRSRIRDLPRKTSCQLHTCTDAFAVPSSVIAALDDSPQTSEESPAALLGGPKPVFVTECLMQASLSLLVGVVMSSPRLRQAVDACAHVSDCVAADDSLWSQLQSQSDCTSEIVVARLDGSRLWSLLEVVDQVLQLRDVLRSAPSSPLQSIVASDQFWYDTALAQELLRPFGFLVALSEAGHLNSSMVLTGWLLVWATARHAQGLSEEEKQTIASAVLAHIQSHASSALVCFALDPRCRGVALSALGKRKVRAMVVASAHQLDPHTNQSALLEQVVKYLNGERPFDDEASWQMMASLPRLFWVEYIAEAPELAAVALGALSSRPFIHSLEHTWERMFVDSGIADNQQTALKKIAFGLNLLNTQASDTRKQSLSVAARLLVRDAASDMEPPPVEMGEDQPLPYTSALPADCAHAFWNRFARVAETFGSRGSAVADPNGDSVDATWFVVDGDDAVAQLRTSLQKALFGESAGLREHYDATEDTATRHAAATAVASAAVASADESASEMLSGLVGLGV